MSLFAVLFLIFFSRLQGDDWPRWRGPHRNGISLETSWSPDTLRNGAKILWQADVGQGHSSFAVRGNLLYTQGSRFRNNKTIYEENVICFDASTGREVWRHDYLTEPRPYTGPRATPTIDADHVYTLGAEGHLFCFQARSGDVIWTKDLQGEGLSKNSDWGFCGSPVVLGDRLIVTAGDSGIAFQKDSGKVIWKSGPGKAGLGTPVPVSLDGEEAVLINNDRNLFAVRVKDGGIVWTYPWPYCDADPVVFNDTALLIGGKPGQSRCNALVDIGTGSAKVSWPTRKMNISPITWIVYEGHAYGLAYDKRSIHMQCLDLADGSVTWEKRLKNWAGFTISNGFIILTESGGDLVILEASPRAYREIVRIPIWDMSDQSEYPDTQPLCCWTAPVLCNGNIYVRHTFGGIACIDAANLSEFPSAGDDEVGAGDVGGGLRSEKFNGGGHIGEGSQPSGRDVLIGGQNAAFHQPG